MHKAYAQQASRQSMQVAQQALDTSIREVSRAVCEAPWESLSLGASSGRAPDAISVSRCPSGGRGPEPPLKPEPRPPTRQLSRAPSNGPLRAVGNGHTRAAPYDGALQRQPSGIRSASLPPSPPASIASSASTRRQRRSQHAARPQDTLNEGGEWSEQQMSGSNGGGTRGGTPSVEAYLVMSEAEGGVPYLVMRSDSNEHLDDEFASSASTRRRRRRSQQQPAPDERDVHDHGGHERIVRERSVRERSMHERGERGVRERGVRERSVHNHGVRDRGSSEDFGSHGGSAASDPLTEVDEYLRSSTRHVDGLGAPDEHRHIDGFGSLDDPI